MGTFEDNVRTTYDLLSLKFDLLSSFLEHMATLANSFHTRTDVILRRNDTHSRGRDTFFGKNVEHGCTEDILRRSKIPGRGKWRTAGDRRTFSGGVRPVRASGDIALRLW